YKEFMVRHPDISERLTQNLTNCRSDLTEDRIHNWFHEINDYLVANHLQAAVKHPRRIYNADGTAFFLAPKGAKCLIRKHDKTAYSFIGNGKKECLTCLITANALRNLLPPMLIYNYERFPAHIVNMMPKKWAIGKSESGWMPSQTFFDYVANIFNPWLSENEIPRPVLFFVNEHASHLTMDLSNFYSSISIILESESGGEEDFDILNIAKYIIIKYDDDYFPGKLFIMVMVPERRYCSENSKTSIKE
ncbi:hypothetical protein ILUMI_16970, partial [Ignelater luminosus]